MRRDLSDQIATMRNSVDELGAVGKELAASMQLVDASVLRVADAVQAADSEIATQSAGVEETAATVRQMSPTISALDGEIEGKARGVASAEQMVQNIASVAASMEKLGQSFVRLIAASDDGRSKRNAPRD